MYELMKKYTGENESARDLAQEAFVKVYECKEQFESIENAKAFLYTVARHLYLNHCKHEKVWKKFRSVVEYTEGEYEDFLQEVTFQETVRILYQAIDQLAPQGRKIILSGYGDYDRMVINKWYHSKITWVYSEQRGWFWLNDSVMSLRWPSTIRNYNIRPTKLYFGMINNPVYSDDRTVYSKTNIKIKNFKMTFE